MKKMQQFVGGTDDGLFIKYMNYYNYYKIEAQADEIIFFHFCPFPLKNILI